MDSYDPRYLAGVLLFNAQDFFEAHEVWEDMWSESQGLERRFYQGLIQAAVGLCHFGNGNLGGAVKLFHSSRDYLRPCGSSYLGLNLARFWEQMDQCFQPLFQTDLDRRLRPEPTLLPQMILDPAPTEWPNPDDYLPPDEAE